MPYATREAANANRAKRIANDPAFSEAERIRFREHYRNNKESESLRKKEFYKENKDSILARRKANPSQASLDWYKNNPERARTYHSARYERERKKITAQAVAREKERMKTDIGFKLKKRLRTRLKCALKSGRKMGSHVRLLGCTADELKQKLESQFKPGMSWDNWSFTGWHIDHIKPLALFDLTDPEQLKQACHYSNLQPLWAIDNILKGSKILCPKAPSEN